MNAKKAPRPRKKRINGPEEIAVLAYLASTFLKYGPVEHAHSLYSLVVALQPKQRKYRAALAFTALKCGRVEEALAHLEVAFQGREKKLVSWEAVLVERTLRANGMHAESKSLMKNFLRSKKEA